MTCLLWIIDHFHAPCFSAQLNNYVCSTGRLSVLMGMGWISASSRHREWRPFRPPRSFCLVYIPVLRFRSPFWIIMSTIDLCTRCCDATWPATSDCAITLTRLGPVPYFPDMSGWTSGPIFSGEVRFFSGHRSWNVWWWFWKLRWAHNTCFSLFLMSYSS